MNNSNISDILFLPEVAGLDARSSIVRVPPELDVPLTPRVRRLIDAPTFQRLSKISQLGFVRLVYPGATHSRFEHSLGVYRLTLLWLKRLAHEPRFASLVRSEDAELLILAALLHDIGHFPYCHLLEDLNAPLIVSHEELAQNYILGDLSQPIRRDWDVEPENICDVLLKRSPKRKSNETEAEYVRRKKVFHLLASIMSGPIDVDKMDYLMRDSHGAGVPYGKNYDVDRLVGSICLNEKGDGIAISNKGKTAAELMVFARYVMFSEVYWHHASRAATAMFQRACYNLGRDGNEYLLGNFQHLVDSQVAPFMLQLCDRNAARSDAPEIEAARRLVLSLFGGERNIYKRLREFTAMEAPFLYQSIAGRPYSEICEISRRLADALRVDPAQILVDAPPAHKEVEFKIDVFFQNENSYRPLSEVSPVVRALAREQFDDYVKQVRIFVAPEVAPQLRRVQNVDHILESIL